MTTYQVRAPTGLHLACVGLAVLQWKNVECKSTLIQEKTLMKTGKGNISCEPLVHSKPKSIGEVKKSEVDL